MAGYAAGFSGLESFSISLSLSLLPFSSRSLFRSICSPIRSFFLSLSFLLSLVPSRSTARGKAGKEIEREGESKARQEMNREIDEERNKLFAVLRCGKRSASSRSL